MKSGSKAPKKRRLSVTAQKNWDNFLLVSTYQPFKKRVMEVREHLNIPETGFDADEKVSVWHHQKAKQSDEIMDSHDFQKRIRIIRTKFENQEITPREARRESKELHLSLPFNFLTHSTKELAKEFNLPESYQNTIRGYILRNKISFTPATNFTIGPWDPEDSPSDARYVPLRIYTKLTEKDLQEIKEEVNKYFGKDLPSFKNIQKLERNINIETVDIEGELDAVTYKHEKLDRSLIAERFLGNKKKKSEIQKIKETLIRTRKNRFGKK